MDSEKKREKIDSREGNISLSLNSYDYLFSDFDPRDYSEKILSEDFIEECKRAARENEGKIELILLCPKHKRDLKDEVKIKRRIKEYFIYNFKKEHETRKRFKLEGVFWFLMGSIVMVLATLLVGKTNFFLKFLEIMAIPAGWFLFWEGLSKILITSKEKLSDYEFYKKMSGADIIFADYR
ncbi:MAG: hypothetical protein AABY32_04705 [Nanoarchaeota archaeon]